MTDAAARSDLMAVKAMNLMVAAVEQTPRKVWALPCNLDGWTVRDLIGHAIGSATKIVTLIEGGEIWGVSSPADWVHEDPAARLRELVDRLKDGMAGVDLDAPRESPQGQVSLRRALAFPVSDLALHSWDLHRSQSRLVELPEELLAFCRSLVESVPNEMLRRPGGFGPPTTPPSDATPTARLMAHLGRTVDA